MLSVALHDHALLFDGRGRNGGKALVVMVLDVVNIVVELSEQDVSRCRLLARCNKSQESSVMLRLEVNVRGG